MKRRGNSGGSKRFFFVFIYSLRVERDLLPFTPCGRVRRLTFFQMTRHPPVGGLEAAHPHRHLIMRCGVHVDETFPLKVKSFPF